MLRTSIDLIEASSANTKLIVELLSEQTSRKKKRTSGIGISVTARNREWKKCAIKAHLQRFSTSRISGAWKKPHMSEAK